MSRRTIPVTTKRIEDLSVFAHEIIQKAAEAEGTLKMIDAVLENHETYKWSPACMYVV